MWPTFYIPGLARADDLDLVQIGDLPCAVPVIYYDVNVDTPLARAGDLCVLFVTHDSDGSGSNPFTISPSGWTRYIWTSRNSNNRRQYGPNTFAVIWKVLTSDDIATTFTLTHGGGSSPSWFEICARAYIFRNFHPDIPLDCFSYQWSSHLLGGSVTDAAARFCGTLGASSSNVPGDYLFTALTLRSGSTATNTGDPFPDLITLSETLADLWDDCLDQVATGRAWHVRVGLGKTTEYLVNMIPGEDWGSPLTDWSGFGLGTFAAGLSASGAEEKYATLISNTTPGRHYAEVEVALVAGQNYSFHVVTRLDSSRTDYWGITVVPPSGDEFGFVAMKQIANAGGGYCAEGSSPYLDPNSGRLTWWWGSPTRTGTDGTPLRDPQTNCLLFTAQETGTHKLRISVAGGAGSADLSHSSASTVQVYRAALFDSFCSPTWVPSEYDGAMKKIQPGPIHYYDTGTSYDTTTGIGAMSFVVNKNVTLAPAVMLPYLGPALGGMKVASDGLTVTKPTTLGNDVLGQMAASRQVYPQIDGADQSYYAEIEITSLGTVSEGNRLIVGPLHGRFPDSENIQGDGTYGWAQNGTLWTGSTGTTGTAWGAAVGTVLGVLVDYANQQVRFYKDGSLVHTFSMVTAEEHQTLPFLLCVTNSPTGASVFEYVANLTGPFGSRKPSGAKAWDWLHEVT